MKKFKAKIIITLKPSVKNNEGEVILKSLHQLDFTEVTGFNIGRFMEVELDAENSVIATERVESMCYKLLAQSVTEKFSVNVKEIKPWRE